MYDEIKTEIRNVRITARPKNQDFHRLHIKICAICEHELLEALQTAVADRKMVVIFLSAGSQLPQ